MAATLKCDTIQNASSATANITLDTAGNATVGNTLAMGSSFLRNRIINGDMRIDQRNAGASVTPSSPYTLYTVDRWLALFTVGSKFSIQQNAGSVTPPAGFTNYLGATSLSSYSVSSGDIFAIQQNIEGFNVADLGFGTASAKTITLSFWVRSSLTGTFGGALGNGSTNRSYPFTYSISSANTWEQKSVTIAGDTSGTWLTTNGLGLQVIFGLGGGSTLSGTAGSWAAADYRTATGATSIVGTNGATFYITGVQLEVGSVATPFERRQYGQELVLCQRYYTRFSSPAGGYVLANSISTVRSATRVDSVVTFPVFMRVAPTGLDTTTTATDYNFTSISSNTACSALPYNNGGTTNNCEVVFTFSGGLTAGNSGKVLSAAAAAAYLGFSAEL